jgi:carboxylesterase
MIDREPYVIAGGPHAVLLIHGFSGGPAETRVLGERLAAAGHTVAGLRLAGHTGDPADLLGVGWRAWLAGVEQEYLNLRARYEQVSLVGFSLGGALAVLLASKQPVERLALLSMPIRLADDWRIGLLPLARFVIPWFYPLEKADFRDPLLRQRLAEQCADVDIDDPQVQQAIRRMVRLPIAAIDEAQRAVGRARRLLPSVRVPALVLQGREDETIPRTSAERIYGLLGSSQKQLSLWDDTGHQLLVTGPHRERIYATVAAFLAAPGRDM